MKPNKGRTGRWRKRKHVAVPAVNQSCDIRYVELRKWLKDRGFHDSQLRTAHFPDTGRGLMTTSLLQPGDMIISLPESCLLTTDTVLKSYLGDHIRRWRPPISPLVALCTFLVAERYFGDRSLWKPYLDVLPSSYSCPLCWEPEMVMLLPEPLRQRAEQQRAVVQEFYFSNVSFFRSLQSLFQEDAENILSYDAMRWAWCTVNTRTVYMKHTQRDYFSSEQDVYALAPLLDLLNHSPGVQVEAAFNEEIRRYEIRTKVRYRKYDQVFICYGHHDNQRLLLEYGFVAANNPHQSVYVTRDVVLQHLSCADKQLQKKWSLLKENGFLDTLWLKASATFGHDGPSWKLLTALKLLCLSTEEFTYWKKVLLGSFVSESNERSCMELVRTICQHLLEQTSRALQKITAWKSEHATNPHLALVEALRLEELRILQASDNLLQNGDLLSL
ncbi:PREDICTED: SET domain-containing protein 4 [Nanorana parkeri]|uniref:SET domain-containing protein 4 n=1 Tax=Nanorana parkeri TaxID=125878 RepID=UPI000854511A|nr:PREDICTED: SET domain-containing protein 4 [Nanorana parkeri]